MGIDVKLVGIQILPIEGVALSTPQVVEEVRELGFTNLWGDLDAYHAAVYDGGLTKVPHPKREWMQYLVDDPDTFLTHVRDNPHYWDSVAMGWNEALATLQKDLEQGHLTTWWIIAEY